MSEAIELYNSATFRVITDDQNPDKREIWATQKEMAKAFGVDVSVVTKHIKDILQDGELQEDTVCARIAHTASDGKTYKVKHYSLDMIIAVGFRIKSSIGIRFRIWANNVIKQYSTQGCAIDLNAMANGYRKSEPWSEGREGSLEDSHK